jgi:hypothetical protein
MIEGGGLVHRIITRVVPWRAYIVTEVLTSSHLKTILCSKHRPRRGGQTWKLTNLVRTEPEASLFEPPPDFKLLDSP